MRTNNWFWKSLSLAAVVGVLATACGSGTSANKPAIKLGVLAGLTGDSAVIGVPYLNGAKMAADEINAKGGINGQKVELVIQDNQTSPTVGVAAAVKMTNVDKVNAIVCSCFSVIFFPVVSAIKSKHIVILNTGASAKKVRDLRSDGVVSSIELDDTQGAQLADWAYSQGNTTAAMLTDTDPYGIGFHDVVMPEFKKQGGTIALDVIGTAGQSDYRAELRRLIDAQNSYQVIFSSTSFTEGKLQFQQLAELGGTRPWYVLYPTLSGFQTLPGANGKLFGIEGTFGGSFAATWSLRYKQLYGTDPNYQGAAQGYDDVMLAAEGVANASDPSSVASVEAALKQFSASYEGATGSFKFDSDWTRIDAPLGKYKLENGKYVRVG